MFIFYAKIIIEPKNSNKKINEKKLSMGSVLAVLKITMIQNNFA